MREEDVGEYREMWDAQHHGYRKTEIAIITVNHTKYEGKLYLVVVQGGREPWYLVTNGNVKTAEQAWEIARIYASRWQIQLVFRYKGENWQWRARVCGSVKRAISCN